MARLETGLVLPQEQQVPRAHKKLDEYVGVAITGHTYALLSLIRSGRIHYPKPVKDYLEGETFDYLREAQKGSLSLFNWQGLLFDDIDPTIGDAAHHALVVFTALPTYGMSFENERESILRKNMMPVPKARDDFLGRVRELRTEVWKMAEGRVDPRAHIGEDPPLFRTFEFFRVASELPLVA